MWSGHRLLATARRMAASGRLATHPRSIAGRTAPPWRNRFVACARGQFIHSRHAGGKKAGLNPTDRRKLGSKHHVIVDAQGIPLAVVLTGANRHDMPSLMRWFMLIRTFRASGAVPCASRESFRATGATVPNLIGNACVSEASHPCSQKSARRMTVGSARHVGQSSVRLRGFTRFDASRFVTNALLTFTKHSSLTCALCWARLKPSFN